MKAFLLSCSVFSALVLSSAVSVACAQDPGMMAAQQAMDAAQQANQQAMQASQQASQQAMQDAQNAAQNQAPAVAMTRAPKFSSGSGKLTTGTLVRITSPSHYATIYYTTDGWSPTTKSKKYTGPVKISHDTVLQAMAIAPNMTHSVIARAEYTVPGSSPVLPATLSTDGVLRAGTKLRLVTATQVNSKAVQVGDRLPLQLDQDIMAGDKVILAKGTTVDALVTQADPPGHAGIPGDIVFEVNALAANGITISVLGGETMEGPNHLKRTVGLLMIPGIGPATLLAHGDQAVIKPGMTFCVTVQTDTPLLATAAAAGTGSR
ncbi:chitobiase/beta-hexosaminidase C-terminal domain-containing protein [Terracidiphilus gabretensis]|jgi:Chitobiase/beta-hexosaminidase C-terminal domain|uniref:chitobiase/beta-hexosaminidase C-terminal domain-containing protein n=1 Tax=Terracidiphilus gabretensis TaxID=1577687 RepID=UPI00071B004B|nr:chitobiase/beta-hexosaminidase C-terminal domain-containing protein [Terracidiphilus gabretensis]